MTGKDSSTAKDNEQTEVPERERKSKYGIVILKDWMANPIRGNDCRMVSGPIELVTAKESFGFTPKGNETNWGVLVGTESQCLILGCQIRSIYWGAQIETNDLLCWRLP